MRLCGVIHLNAEQMLSVVKPAAGSPASQHFQRLSFNLLLQVAASNETIQENTASEAVQSFPGRRLRKSCFSPYSRHSCNNLQCNTVENLAKFSQRTEYLEAIFKVSGFGFSG